MEHTIHQCSGPGVVSEEKDEKILNIMLSNHVTLQLVLRRAKERESINIPSTYQQQKKPVLKMSFDWYKTWHDGIENQSILCIFAVCSMEICFLFAQFIFVSIEIKTEKTAAEWCLLAPTKASHARPHKYVASDFHVMDLFVCHNSTEMSKRKCERKFVWKTKKKKWRIYNLHAILDTFCINTHSFAQRKARCKLKRQFKHQ